MLPQVEVNPPSENSFLDWIEQLPPEFWAKYLPVLACALFAVWLWRKPVIRGILIAVALGWLIFVIAAKQI